MIHDKNTPKQLLPTDTQQSNWIRNSIYGCCFVALFTASSIVSSPTVATGSSESDIATTAMRSARQVFIDPASGERLSANDPRIESFRSHKASNNAMLEQTSTQQARAFNQSSAIIQSPLEGGGQYLVTNNSFRSYFRAHKTKDGFHTNCKLAHAH